MSHTHIVQTDRIYLGHGTDFVHVNPDGEDWAGTRGCADPQLVTSYLRAPRQATFIVDGALWGRVTPREATAAQDLWGGVCRCERAAQVDTDVSVDEVDPWIERVAESLCLVVLPVCVIAFIAGIWVLAVQR